MEAPVPSAPPAPADETGRTGLPRRVWLVALAAIAVGSVLLLAFDAIRPFLLGVVLVYLLAPLVDRLTRIGLPRAGAVLLVFALAIAVLILVATLALTPLVSQLNALAADLPSLLARLRAGLDGFAGSLNLAPSLRDFVDGLIDSASGGLADLDLTALLRPVIDSVFIVVGTITAYAILPAWLFFVLKDRARLADSLERSLPPAWRADVFAVSAMVDRVFGNWIRGQLLLGAVVGLASWVGLEVLGFTVDPVFARYAVLLALIAGLLELVPFIGPIIAAIPAVLIGLTVGPQAFLAALVLYLAIQQVENNILVPKIQGDAVELHPSAVMIALVVGASVAGVLGAIISLPITAAARDIFRYLFRRLSEPPEPVAVALASVSPRLLVTARPVVLGTAGGPDSADPAEPSKADAPGPPTTAPTRTEVPTEP